MNKPLLSVLVPLSLLLTAAAVGAEAPGRLNMAYSARLFGGAHQADIKATSMALVAHIRGDNPAFSEGDVLFYDSFEEWKTAAEQQAFEFCVLSSLEYLQLEPHGLLEPLFLPEDRSGIGEELLVLTHQQSGLESIEQLTGRNLLLPQSSYSPIALRWLDSLGIRPKTLVKSEKSGKVILSTFFSRNSACLVTRGAFDAMTELNPQIGRQMKVLAVSPKYIAALVCVRRHCAPQNRALVLETLPGLGRTHASGQLMVAYGIERFAPFSPAYLKPLRRLLTTPPLRPAATQPSVSRSTGDDT